MDAVCFWGLINFFLKFIVTCRFYVVYVKEDDDPNA